MLKPKPLTVKAVTKYKRAGYPSHQDPDPLASPAPVPYPFHMKTLAYAAAITACVPAACGNGDKESSVKQPYNFFKASRFAPPRASYFSPPPPSYVGPGYGVGMDMVAPIDLSLAREAIFNAFKKEHVRLSPKVAFEAEGLRFIVDGYSPQKHLGFIMVGEGLYGRSWEGIPIQDKLDLQCYLANLQLYRMLRKLDERANYSGYVALWAIRDSDPRADSAEMRELASTHPIEIEASRMIAHDFPSDFSQYEKLQDKFLQRFGQTLQTDWDASKIEVYKEVLERLSAETGPTESRLSDTARSMVDHALKSGEIGDLSAAVEECRASRLAWNNPETLEPDELSIIDNMSKDNKEYIAVIGRTDIQFRYTPLSDSKDAYHQGIENALKDLEAKVRGYIRWARRQGLQ